MWVLQSVFPRVLTAMLTGPMKSSALPTEQGKPNWRGSDTSVLYFLIFSGYTELLQPRPQGPPRGDVVEIATCWSKRCKK